MNSNALPGAEQSTSAPITSKAPVLVIEDDAPQRALLSRWLEGSFDVAVAEDGRSARYRLMSERWSLVVCDLRLPFVGGVELLSSFREHNRDTPFLLISASPEFADAQAAVRLGASDLLVKPLNRTGFVARALELVGSGEHRGGSDVQPGVPAVDVARLIQDVNRQTVNQMALILGYSDLLTVALSQRIPDLAACRMMGRSMTQAAESFWMTVGLSLRSLAASTTSAEDPVAFGRLLRDACDTIRDSSVTSGARQKSKES